MTVSVTTKVRDLLLRSGFHRVGFARANRAPHADHFYEWLRRGFAANMHYLARNAARRTDPREVVPDARSVIALAVHYHPPEPASLETPPPDRGVISCYAQGTDYHAVIERRLRSACRKLRDRFPESVFRYYVDTGPVLERSWAERAGLGWIGKNACVIDPDRGSYFFIAVIITTLELDPDEPIVDHCGTCRLCLDICPTDAIVAPYQVNANRCISYQTIENREAIPESLRWHVGNLIFGCDLCQEVCPFNREREGATPPPKDPELAPRPENQLPRLDELAELADEEAFRRRFPKSAVRRAKATGLVRNAIIAIANSGDDELAPVLERIADRMNAAGERALDEVIAWARRQLAAAGLERVRSEEEKNDPKGI